MEADTCMLNKLTHSPVGNPACVIPCYRSVRVCYRRCQRPLSPLEPPMSPKQAGLESRLGASFDGFGDSCDVTRVLATVVVDSAHKNR